MYFAFLDLEKAYDRIDRKAMWRVLRIYGIGGRLGRIAELQIRMHVNSSDVHETYPVVNESVLY